MRKQILKTLALALVFTMLLSVSGLALGTYDYKLLGESAGIYISGDSITTDPNVTASGEISVEKMVQILVDAGYKLNNVTQTTKFGTTKNFEV